LEKTTVLLIWINADIGRSAELEVLLSMLDRGPQVVFVHGIDGIGKFTLLEAFAEQARSRGATVVRLDCRGVEPTDRIWAEASAGAGRVGDTGDEPVASERLRDMKIDEGVLRRIETGPGAGRSAATP